MSTPSDTMRTATIHGAMPLAKRLILSEAPGSSDVATVGDYSADDGVFKTRVDIRFGGHVPSTWATPKGAVDGHIASGLTKFVIRPAGLFIERVEVSGGDTLLGQL